MAIAFVGEARPRSRRTAVLTNAGGPGILTADALEANGLTVVDLDPDNPRRPELTPGEMVAVDYCPNPDCPAKKP